MFDILLCLLCLFLYLAFRPRRTGIMIMNDMFIEYPQYMDQNLIRAFLPLVEWQQNIVRGLLTQGAIVEKVSIRDSYMFGSRIGFMFIDVTVHMHGVALPGAVLLRGKSVAVLLWYRDGSDVRVILVRQPRVAMGRTTWEVPTGMPDETGTLRGQMFKEIQEETGLTLNINNLTHHESSYMSPGLLDETLELYSMHISPDMRTTNSRCGNVEAVSLSDPRTLDDAKLCILICAVDLKTADY